MSILDVTAKDLRLFARDPAALLFILLVPIVVIAIIAGTQGRGEGSGIVLPVVNEDEGPVAEVLIEMLGRNVEIVEVDRERAEALVGVDNEAAAALVVPAKTSKRYLGNRPSTLTLLTDPAKGVEVNTIKAYFLLANKDAATLADPLYQELLELEEQNATGSRLEIPQHELLVPGFSIMFVLMGVYFGVALGLRDEKDWGALTRLRIAPVSKASILTGKLLARFLVGVVQFVILFAFGYFAFDLAIGRSLPALAIVLTSIVFSLTGFSLLVASFARGREQLIPLGLTVVMVVCALGGCWWPIYDQQPWLQTASRVLPTSWATVAIHDVILRERGVLDILPGASFLVAYGAVCLAAGARLYRWAD